MKKIILSSLVLLGLTLNANAQSFAFTSTSASYTGSGAPASGNGEFYSYQPGYGVGNYVDINCSVASNTTSSDPNQLGGFDANVYDATTATPSRSGTIFYGGSIRNMYTGSPCAAQTPGFGFTFNSAQVVDLTIVANQKLQFTYTNNTGTNLNVELQLFDKPGYVGKLISFPYTFLADATSHSVTLDFSAYLAPSADLTNVAQVTFLYPFNTKSPDFGLSFANINLGSSVTGTNSRLNNSIASSSVYPNPSIEMATVSVNLKASSDLKITLSDLMGKEVATIAEGTYTSLEKSFSVANLNKGIYTVNYFVDGAAAKSELLMVK